MDKKRHPFRIALLSLAGLILFIAAAVQIILNTSVLNRIVDRIAEEYIDGSVSFRKAHFNLFRHFPNFTVTIEDFDILYDREKFSGYGGDEYYLVRMGRGESADTLASFRRFSISLNMAEALKGRIVIPYASLDKPRIFAHMFSHDAANWDIIRLPEADDGEEDAGPQDIRIKRIRLTGRPSIVFTDQADTVFAAIGLERLRFKGDFSIAEPRKSTGGFSVDSMMIAARLPADTLALRINRCDVDGMDDGFTFGAKADAFLATGALGRLKLPIETKGVMLFPKRDDDAFGMSLGDFHLQAATIGLDGEAEAILYDDSTYIRASASIDDSPVKDVTAFLGNAMPQLKKLDTDATISLEASCDGFYVPASGAIPSVKARFAVPQSAVSYEDIDRDGRIGLEVTAYTDRTGKLDVELNELLVDAGGMDISMKGKAGDLLGEDPEISMEGSVKAAVDTLARLFTADYGIRGTGSLKADVKGSMKMSQFDRERFAEADINGDISIDGLHIDDGSDSLRADVRHAEAKIRTAGNKIDTSMPQGARVLGVKAELDSLDLTLAETMFLRAGGISIMAQNSAESRKSDTTGALPFMGILKADRIEMQDATGLALSLDGSRESFRIIPASATAGTVLRISSSNEAVNLDMGEIAATLKSLAFKTSAQKIKRAAPNAGGERRRQRRDSLRRNGLPDWLRESSFRSGDLNLRIDESIAKYFREWNVEGSLSLGEGEISTPFLPLRNTLHAVEGKFTGDRVDIDSFTFRSGESDISLKGSLGGIRRALLSRSGYAALRLDAAVSSEKINANELIGAFLQGSGAAPEDTAATEAPAAAAAALFIVPANLNATINLSANSIKYGDLDIRRLASMLSMRQRCLQITDAKAESDIGNISFDAFYSTKNKEDLQAGFDMKLSDITADKVIRMFPAADTIMPMLKSFSGNLNCEMAATTDLDTSMNLILPSIDGVLRISGTDLTLKESEEFTRIAKMLMFKDDRSAHVDRMSVDGMIRDNRLEVFPFVFKIDRYTLAASGLQYLSSSYKYHISVIKSPLPLKFGLNVYGDDFDHMKLNIGKALYKNANVPVFSRQLDTVQTNLASHIRNIFDIGVSRAIEANRRQDYIGRQMAKVNYGAEDIITDSLPGAEKALLAIAKAEMEKPAEEPEAISEAEAEDGTVIIEEDELIGDIVKDARNSAKASRKALAKERRAAGRKKDNAEKER